MKKIIFIATLLISSVAFSQPQVSIEPGTSNHLIEATIEGGYVFKNIILINTGIRGQYNKLFLVHGELGVNINYRDFWFQVSGGTGYLTNMLRQDTYVPNPGDTIYNWHGLTTNGLWVGTETIRVGWTCLSLSICYSHKVFWYSAGITIKLDN